jgi:hypothetical protein
MALGILGHRVRGADRYGMDGSENKSNSCVSVFVEFRAMTHGAVVDAGDEPE